MKSRLLHRLNPFLDIAKTGWENRDQLGYAWRILNKGVCDGCALGTNGMRDWTMDGIHLCWIRLNLLRLNTMPAFDTTILRDISALRQQSEKELRKLGRIPAPLLRLAGQPGFTPVKWEKAYELMADNIRQIDPERLAFYLVSRGTVNETYYVAQKVARFLGTNHIDNSARVCHAPSTTALKQTIGYAATTCSYKDMIGSDLIVFFGSNPANNQPVVMKYLHYAKKKGTKIICVNTFKEPGMEKYFVPSAIDSALFGTEIADDYFVIKPGGDIAFINGVLKHLIENDWVSHRFIEENTGSWDALVRLLKNQTFEELEMLSGVSTYEMLRFARKYAAVSSSIFVWSMGITMHKHGVENVKSIVNLALSRGMVGKPKSGLMAIRGHSGVQGGAEVGAVPNQFPGGFSVNPEEARRFATFWGFKVPEKRGYFAAEMLDAAHDGKLDFLYCIGSNLFGILPDSHYVKQAIGKIPFRVHHDIVLNPQMLLDPAETVLILPATTRYEMAGGNTETTTERRIIFNPEIPGPRISGARDEWQVLMNLAKLVNPDHANRIHFDDTAAIREEIAQAVPFYRGIEQLTMPGDQFQWGGERLGSGGLFPTGNRKASFALIVPPQKEVPPGYFRLSTRRGKQFNSMTFSDTDPLVNGKRETIIFSPQDLRETGLTSGDPVRLHSATGEFVGIAVAGEVVRGTIIMYWPEANVLIPRGVSDPLCGIPAYRDAVVQIEKLPKSQPVS